MLNFLCALSFLSGALAFCHPASITAIGYIEGDYVQIAPVETARITAITTTRGMRAREGTTLAALDDTDLTNAMAEQQARLKEAIANLSNIESGKRPEELAVIAATLASAKATAEQTASDYARKRDLFASGFATKADLDLAKANNDIATARINEISANLDVANLPARPDELIAARARISEATAALDTLMWRHSERQLKAPASGQVFDIIRHGGDMAGPQAPVIAFLPDANIKLKFYIAESERAALAPATKLRIACDGCRSFAHAHVTYIAPQAEFTPPVIFSTQARQKLSFLVEAKLDEDGLSTPFALQPGQIVDVLVDAP